MYTTPARRVGLADVAPRREWRQRTTRRRSRRRPDAWVWRTSRPDASGASGPPVVGDEERPCPAICDAPDSQGLTSITLHGVIGTFPRTVQGTMLTLISRSSPC